MGRCPLTVAMSFLDEVEVRSTSIETPPVPARRVERRTPIGIVSIWDDLKGASGRPTDRPWGAPYTAWDAARKRFERRQAVPPAGTVSDVAYKHRARSPNEVRRRILAHFKRVCHDLARADKTLWVKPEKPAAPYEAPEVPQMTRVETVFQPAGSTSPSMVRMILTGRMPGFEWDPARGVIRVRMEIRVRPVDGSP